jgi:predicted deacylase
LVIGGERIRPGETRDLSLKISESYTGLPIGIPVRVIRAKRSGPVLFLTAAIHGDELNGTRIVREILSAGIPLIKGSLICLPVVNVFGFERNSRYLPDRRDLNRSFPGHKEGSLAARMAHTLFREVVSRCDYGIDFHTAAANRINFPHVRGDLKIPGMSKVAFAFGCELVLDRKGVLHTLRRTASKNSCPTILYEAGEVFKFEPGSVRIGVRGVFNVLKALGMIEGELREPAYQTTVERDTWVRSPAGGLLRFHVSPGEIVRKGTPLATCEPLFSGQGAVILSPVSGIVMGMTTLPAVKPGEPICHMAIPTASLTEIKRKIDHQPRPLHDPVQKDQAHNFLLEEATSNVS